MLFVMVHHIHLKIALLVFHVPYINILLILLQQRGASLGAGLSGSGELNTERRGLERSMYNVTIVIAVIFIISILAILII